MGKWESKPLQIIYVSGQIHVIGLGAESKLATQLWGASKGVGVGGGEGSGGLAEMFD